MSRRRWSGDGDSTVLISTEKSLKKAGRAVCFGRGGWFVCVPHGLQVGAGPLQPAPLITPAGLRWGTQKGGDIRFHVFPVGSGAAPMVLLARATRLGKRVRCPCGRE